MNRVTLVNLAGQAWHVEESGVSALDAWLDEARLRLARDPDRDELIRDFERAIADRFAHLAPAPRDVVTSANVDEVLAALGTVEPALDDDDPATAATAALPTVETTAASASDGWRERRLYRLTGDDSMLAGVCAGIAAYLRVDVTVVRVVTVLLTLLTSGLLIVGYIAMAIIVPEARTPEQRAEARGTGRTAQEMLARARAGASPALATLGSLITRVARAVAVAIRWVLLLAILLLLAAWALAIGWLAIDPDPVLQAFDDGTSAWIVGLWITCLAWIPTALLLALERGMAAMLRPADAPRSRPATIALSAGWVASVVVALLGTFAIPASHSTDLSALTDGRGEVRILDQDVCVDLEGRTSAAEPACADGADIVISDDDDDRDDTFDADDDVEDGDDPFR